MSASELFPVKRVHTRACFCVKVVMNIYIYIYKSTEKPFFLLLIILNGHISGHSAEKFLFFCFGPCAE